MTVTPGTGAPDWQDYTNWRSELFAAVAFSVTSVTPVNRAVYLSNWASAYLNVHCLTGNGMTVTIAYYTDATMTKLVDTWSYILVNQTDLSVNLPGLGNYLVVTLNTAQAGSQTGFWQLTVVNEQNTIQRYPHPQKPASGTQSVSASGNFVSTLLQVMEGEGTFWCSPSDASGKIFAEVIQWHEDGVSFDILTADFLPAVTSQSIERHFISGTQPVVVRLLNTDGAGAHQCVFWCNVLPR